MIDKRENYKRYYHMRISKDDFSKKEQENEKKLSDLNKKLEKCLEALGKVNNSIMHRLIYNNPPNTRLIIYIGSIYENLLVIVVPIVHCQKVNPPGLHLI